MLCCMLPFWVKSQPMEEYNTKVREVIVICKTHFDIGYTHRVNDVVNYYQTEMIGRKNSNLPGHFPGGFCQRRWRIGRGKPRNAGKNWIIN